MKRAEKALRQSEERLRTLIHAIPDIIMRFDRQIKHLYVSPTVRSVFDMDPAAFLGKTSRELGFPEDLCSFWEASIRVVFESGAPLEREFSYNGISSRVVFNWRLIPETGDRGEVQTVLSICRDITEQKRAEVQLQQAQKMESIGRLAAGVSHDFNNMLSPILGYAELLMMDLIPSDDRFRQVSEIKKAAERSRDLTRQLLAFSRKQVLELKVVDLGRLIQNFEKLMRRTLREDIELKLSLSADPSTILADVGQVEQVLMNLAVNSQDAMPDGGLLTIETGVADLDEEDQTLNPDLKPGRYVTLAVSDTGIGMDEGTREHIFEPFFTTKGILGTGLGLATVYGIVKQHEGNIRVHSVPGKGATFKIYLPAAAAEDDAPPAVGAKTEEQHLGRSETVLVVEDNEMVREMTSRVLSRQGFTVLSAANGRECLDLLKEYKGPLHLLLTDVIMPDMNGKELFDKVAESFPLVRVISCPDTPTA
jgi:PAS domain S-box-containing protein